MNKDFLPGPTIFEWDSGNIDKNPIKHGIKNEESESIFFDTNSIFAKDLKHSKIEHRYQILGKSKSGRMLSIFFTIRKEKIRIISSRQMNVKEKKFYINTNEN